MRHLPAPVTMAALVISACCGWVLAAGDADESTQPAWTADPEDHGESIPPTGRSVFDFIVADRAGGYEVPFPFDRLVARIETIAGQGSTRRVLIPLGRSLQRNAATPDFFEYPRAVVAVDGDAGADGAPLLKDRLFLGYQERAEIIEVISYNETGGRFEFQIVADYRLGGSPRVQYVERSECVPCHQGHAPIFSRGLWDETNANAAIGRRLAVHRNAFYGIDAVGTVDESSAFDDATDRAAFLSAWQALWTAGCASPDAGAAVGDPEAVRCRGDALLSALRYRLAGSRHTRLGANEARARLAVRLAIGMRTHWPHGLAIADPDIPNRSIDFDQSQGQLLDLPGNFRAPVPIEPGERKQMVAVTGQLEPFVKRAPIAVWRDTSDLAHPLVAGLAGFLATSEVKRLDAHLAGRSTAPQRHQTTCRFESTGALQRVRCGSDGAELVLDATVPDPHADPDVRWRARLHRLRFPGRDELRDLAIVGDSPSLEGRGSYAVRDPRTGLAARLTDGAAIRTLTLQWPAAGRTAGRVTIDVVDDFDRVADAVDTLVSRTVQGETRALSAAPFRRAVVVGELFSIMDIDGEWCCTDVSSLPPARLQGRSETDNGSSG